MSRLELVRPGGTEERGLRLSRDVISTSNCRPACARAAVVAETLAFGSGPGGGGGLPTY